MTRTDETNKFGYFLHFFHAEKKTTYKQVDSTLRAKFRVVTQVNFFLEHKSEMSFLCVFSRIYFKISSVGIHKLKSKISLGFLNVTINLSGPNARANVHLSIIFT